ncbi:phosphatidylinositol kinase, partial [Glutamicibacter creatinolyticus]
GWKHVLKGQDETGRIVELVHEDSPALRCMAVFDILVNNADRKGNHILGMPGGHRYGVDHGLTFHREHKLRTVLWG